MIDTWESTGLRGTASHDYEVRDVFVPEHRTLWFQEPPSERGPLYRMPPVAMFATFIAAVQLGIARHAIDAFVELATTKIPTMSQIVLADRVTAQASLGRATALVSSARGYLENALQSLWDRVQAGHAPTLGDRGDLWLASAHAGHTAHAAIDMLYTAAGATAVYATSPLDRCLRDARTALQHVCTQEINSAEVAGAGAPGSRCCHQRVDDRLSRRRCDRTPGSTRRGTLSHDQHTRARGGRQSDRARGRSRSCPCPVRRRHCRARCRWNSEGAGIFSRPSNAVERAAAQDRWAGGSCPPAHRGQGLVGDARAENELPQQFQLATAVYCYCYCDAASQADAHRRENLDRLSRFRRPVPGLLASLTEREWVHVRRSKRSHSTPGRTGMCCWLVTRRTPARQTWPTPPWHSKTRSCSPIAYSGWVDTRRWPR